MINRIFRQLVTITLLGSLLVGCASNGYISSTITTGIGLDVSSNPQTQIPHVRFGYIRNGVYYVPTGKTGNPNGDVTATPNVVSKIHVGSEFLKNITISEKFAVGPTAVDSEGAKQLFADVSTELGSATESAIRGVVVPPPPPRPNIVVTPEPSQTISSAEISAAIKRGFEENKRDELQAATIAAFNKWKAGKRDEDAKDILNTLTEPPSPASAPRTIQGLLKFIRVTTDEARLSEIRQKLEA